MKDDWVRTAMTDDSVVVELLFRLQQAQAAAPAKPQAVIPLRWGLRLARSKPPTPASLRCDFLSRRKDGDSPARCSPTTPLSWSGSGGAASTSATADGFEVTSRRVSRSPSGVRSKGTNNAETASTTTITKKSRKKKTFAELKEEEGLLMKERTHLKKEIATLNATFKEQTERNDNLKRIKLDLNLQYAKVSSLASEEVEANYHRGNQSQSSSLNITSTYKGDDNTESGSCETHEGVPNHHKSFVLPDLNVMPTEEDTATETRFKSVERKNPPTFSVVEDDNIRSLNKRPLCFNIE